MTTPPVRDAVTIDRVRVLSTALSVIADTLGDINREVLDVVGAGTRSIDHHHALHQLGSVADAVTVLTARVVILAVHAGHLPESVIPAGWPGAQQ